MILVLKTMDQLQSKGQRLTYDNIAKATGKKLTAYQVEGLMRRFRHRFFKDDSFVVRAKIIARHYGKAGERKLLG